MYKKFEETLSFDDVLLVPRYSNIISRKEVDTSTLLSLNKKVKIDLPIISANMDTITESKMAIAMGKMGGLGVVHRFLSIDSQVLEIKKIKKEKLLSAAAVGVKNGEIERAHALVKAGVDILVLDIAHGHSKYAIEKVKYFKKNFKNIFIIAGNVATAEGFMDLAKAGADAVKVGIGAGSICTTRIVTGFGIPQISAILNCAPIAQKLGIGLISDGGAKSSGDIVKAIAAGADAVMIGNILSGTDETPGKLITIGGKKYKQYHGMASLQANLIRPDKKNNQDEIIEEGVSGIVPYKGKVEDVVKKIIGGLRSGLSYAGSKNLSELKKNTSFVRITPSGLRESNWHDIILR